MCDKRCILIKNRCILVHHSVSTFVLPEARGSYGVVLSKTRGLEQWRTNSYILQIKMYDNLFDYAIFLDCVACVANHHA